MDIMYAENHHPTKNVLMVPVRQTTMCSFRTSCCACPAWWHF